MPTTLTGPPLDSSPEPHLLAALWRWAERDPERPLLSQRLDDEVTSWTAAQLRAEVTALAAGLVARGIEAGDRVLLVSRTRAEWVLLDHAILAAGAVTVPVYETASTDQVQAILANSGARLALVETPEHEAVVAEAAARAAAPVEISAIASGVLADLRSAGTDHLDAVDARVAALGSDDLAAILYSSGTTGEPKGCELTHGNLCANVRQTVQQVPELFGDGARTLACLPLAHALGRIQVHVALDQGVEVATTSDVDSLPGELARVRPTFLVGVPRLFDRLVYRRLRDALGGQVTAVICGGAALAPEIGRRFDGIGIPVLEGFGATETAPIVSGGPYAALHHGTVGRPYPATSVRLAEDGEILVQGPQVFRGYRGDPDATAAALRDGWYHTGDLGAVTADGHLRIVGRKKDILITAGGKNVVPGPLEDRIRAHPLVEECVVVGDQRPYVTAIVWPEPVAARRLLAAHGHATKGPTADCDAGLGHLTPAAERLLRSHLDDAVADANRTVSRAESIGRYTIADAPLSLAAGSLTPTAKVRRAVVLEHFAADVERLSAAR